MSLGAGHIVLLLTGLALTTLLGLGLALQRGWRRDLARWPHHVLFLAACVGTVLSGVLAGQRGLALLPTLGLLLTMPRTRPGRADHWQRALACAGAFGLGAWWAWG